MTINRLLALPLVLVFAVSCGLIDDIKLAINSLTEVSQGNLKSLVGSSSETMKEAGEQLEQLKTTKPQSNSETRFQLGGAPALMTLLPAQDESSNCPSITREKDMEAGTRTITSDFSACSAEDGRSGTIVSTLLEEGEDTELTVTYDDFVQDGETKNGEIKWAIIFTGLSNIVITTNEQLELKTFPGDTEQPVVLTTQQTVIYTIKPVDQTLTIDGSGSFQQNEETATLSFATILFDFSDDGCTRGPVSGSVAMTNSGKSFSVSIASCGNATATSDEGSVSLGDAAVEELFNDTLDALLDFFKRLNSVANKELAADQCKASEDKVDAFEGDGRDNNTAAKATDLDAEGLQPKGSATEGKGITVRGLVLADDDWYQITLDKGTWAILAMPKSADAIWPMICVYEEGDSDTLISHLPETPSAIDCYPGGADITLSASKTVWIQATDEFSEYMCQTYALVIFDPSTPYQLPELDVSGGGDCPREWISDDICDNGCHGIWDELELNYDDDVDVCANPDAYQSSDCPLVWIGDDYCDSGCISVWGATAKNPDTNVANGDDDGGDCDGTAPGSCSAGQGTCEIPGSTNLNQCVNIDGLSVGDRHSVGCNGTCPGGTVADLDEVGFWCMPLD